MEKTKAKIAVLLAEGFEEVEALTVVDYCRRAGIEVVMAACRPEFPAGGNLGTANPLWVTGSHGISVAADVTAEEAMEMAAELDGVVAPGGMPGALNLKNCVAACLLLATLFEDGKIVAAECAAPAVVLSSLGLLEGHRWTCYPGMETQVQEWAGEDWREVNKGNRHSKIHVVVHANLITSKGPGVAEEFAHTLVRILAGEEAGEELRKGALLRPPRGY